MTTVPDHSTVARLLGRLDRSTFGRFVADLWTLRGRAARFDGDVVHVADTSNGQRVLLIAQGHGGLFDRSSATLPGGVAPRDVLAVVSNDEDDAAARLLAERAEADLVGPADLRRMVLYAIDRDDCDALFRRYFDRGLGDFGATTPSGSSVSVAPRESTVRVGVSAGLVVLMAVLAVTVAGTTVPGLPAFEPSGVPTTADATARPPATPSSTATATLESTPDRPLGCHPTPRSAVDQTLSAFAANDPETNDGLRRVWEGATVEFRRYAGPFETFVTIMNNYPFVGLLDPAGIEYGNQTQSERVAQQTIIVTSTGGAEYVYTLTLVLTDDNQDAEGCWSLSGLTYRSQNRSTNATTTANPPSPAPSSTAESTAESTADSTIATVSPTLKNV